MNIDAHHARGPNATDSQPTIVVGYDGSKESIQALLAAATRVGEAGKIVAVHAAEPASPWLDTPFYIGAVRRREERVWRLFDELSDLDLGNVTVEAELVDGPAPEALAEVARSRDAREIIVGSRGLGRFRAALNSVSHRLLRIADRPVIVIPKIGIRATPHTPHP
jgi:nucleotide-binding universal stress UspA family protein